MKILALSGSNSCHSINQQLLCYIIRQIQHLSVELIPYTTFNLPIYSVDMEQFVGIPESVQLFAQQLHGSDGLILTIPEHNGNVSAYFKNLIDWLSRVNPTFLANTKVFLLSASPRLEGGGQVLRIMNDSILAFGGEVTAQLSVGNFEQHFIDAEIHDLKVKMALQTQLMHFIQSLFGYHYLQQAS